MTAISISWWSAAPALLFYRSNLDGTFTEMAKAAFRQPNRRSTRDAAFADFDGDGRIVSSSPERGRGALYHNEGGRQFADVIATSGRLRWRLRDRGRRLQQ
jgi:hypothetical protein